MNLESKYLGYNLRSPFVLSASPIATDIDNLYQPESWCLRTCSIYACIN